MSGTCCFGCGEVFCLLSLACLAIAAGTNFWFVVKIPEDRPTVVGNATDEEFLYPFHAGIFMTCYPKNIPDTGEHLCYKFFAFLMD